MLSFSDPDTDQLAKRESGSEWRAAPDFPKRILDSSERHAEGDTQRIEYEKAIDTSRQEQRIRDKKKENHITNRDTRAYCSKPVLTRRIISQTTGYVSNLALILVGTVGVKRR
jgi:hypothetical protein